MTTDFTIASAGMLVWLVAYLLHSTLMLGMAWVVTRVVGRRSFALQDQIWKLAMVLPILTASLQQAVGPSSLAVAHWTLAWPGNERNSVSHQPTREPSAEQSGVARPDRWDVRGSRAEPVTPEIPHDPVVGAIVDGESVHHDVSEPPDQAASPDNREPNDSTDWTIDIRPGSTVESADAIAARSEVPVFVPSDQSTTETDEELRRAGDEGTSVAGQPPLFGFSSSPHHVIPSSQQPRSPRLLPAVGTLISLHLAFAALRLLALAWRERRRLIATVSANDGPARNTLDQVLVSRGVTRKVQILYARNVRTPAACGWMRWRIVLPPGLDHETPHDELRALLAHELAHLVRRDTVWLWWSHALCVLLPLQPLNFIARRRWEEAAEHLCDAWAVESDVQPLTLAKCLTRVADRYLGDPGPVGMTAVGRQTTLSRRIERLTDGRVSKPFHTRAGRLLVVLLSFTVAAAAVIAAPQVALEREPAPLAESPSEAGRSGNRDEEGMRGTGDEGPEEEDIPPAVDAQSELRNELQTLLADLDRLNELLSYMDDSPELSAAREQMQRRLQQIRKRLAEEPLPHLLNTIELDSESSL